jgi:AraC-like DNA-binding protein
MHCIGHLFLLFRRYGIAGNDRAAQSRSVLERTVRLPNQGPRGYLGLVSAGRSRMLSSITGVFREPDDFQTALQEYGCTNLIATDQGFFRARLTRIALHRMRLLSAEESRARVAFFSISHEAMLVSVPLADNLLPIWGGTAAQVGEIVTLGSGHRTYARSAANCRWGIIVLPTKVLTSYAQTVVGNALAFPSGVSRWRPSGKAFRDLVRLHIGATRVADAQAEVITMFAPATTLEQELIEAVVACLSEEFAQPAHDTIARHDDVMARFEELLQGQPNRAWTSDEICVALDVSGRTLRICCGEHLGMPPNLYIRLRRMQLVRRALRSGDPTTASVAQIAARYGFGEAGRFAGAYRAQFGELPSVTLRRNTGQ